MRKMLWRRNQRKEVWRNIMDKKLFPCTEKIYDDALSPSMKVIGNAASDLLKFVALPFSFLGMTSDELLEKYKIFLDKSVKKVPSENLVNPEPVVITKIFEDVKFAFSDQTLEEMFSNLLSSAINKDTANNIHVSFVNIIGQLDSVDAKLVKAVHDMDVFPVCDVYFTNNALGEKVFNNLCCYEDINGTKLSVSIINLLRLGLIELLDCDTYEDELYKDIKNSEEFSRIELVYEKVKKYHPEYENFKIDIRKKKVVFTTLGEVFSNYVL